MKKVMPSPSQCYLSFSGKSLFFVGRSSYDRASTSLLPVVAFPLKSEAETEAHHKRTGWHTICT